MENDRLSTLQGRGELKKVLMMPDYRKDNPYQTLLADSLKAQGVEVVFPQGYKRAFPIYRAVRAASAEVLHLHWLSPYLKGKNFIKIFFYSLKFLVDIALVKFSGKRIVWTVHNFVSHDTAFERLEEWVQARMIPLVDQMIFHSEYAKSCFENKYRGVKKKSTVIPHGHYRSVYGPAMNSREARKQLALPETGLIFLHLGLLKPYKGIEELIGAWKDNGELFKGHHLVIAGKAWDETYQKRLADMTRGVERLLFFPHFVEDKKIALYMSATDVVVLPFRQILTSGSLILAMSYAKPVIVPRIAGIVETLGDADELVYPWDDDLGLKNSFIKSIEANLGELSSKVKTMCNRLDWDPIGRQTKRAYGYV